MNLKTHLNISKLVLDSLNRTTGESLLKFWFKLGSITPDIHPYYRVQPHHVKKAKKHIDKYIDKIMTGELGQRRLAFLLGKTSHFISDTFCLMHNHQDGKKANVHYRYEKQLSRIFDLAVEPLRAKTANQNIPFDEAKGRAISEYILEKNAHYQTLQRIENEVAAMTADMSYTLHMCMNVLTEMLAMTSPRQLQRRSAA